MHSAMSSHNHAHPNVHVHMDPSATDSHPPLRRLASHHAHAPHLHPNAGSTARSRSRARKLAKRDLTPPPTGLIVVTAKQAILPGEKGPVEVTVEVDKSDGTIRKVWKGVRKEKASYGEERGEVEFIEVPEGHVLMPGLVDAHVHLNQPGRTAWEGFASGTLAAIHGGVTTLIDMPLNSIPSTTSVQALEVKIQAARLGWENWRSQEEAQKLLAGGTVQGGVGAGWGAGRVLEEKNHLAEEVVENLPFSESDEEEERSDHSEQDDQTRMEEPKIPERGRGSISAPDSRAASHGPRALSTLSTSSAKLRKGVRMLDVYGPWNSGSDRTKGGVWCDVGFWGGIVPGNQDDLQPMVDAGVKGFKCFLIESGVDEFPAVDEADVKTAMECLKDTGSVVLFHAEQGQPIHGMNLKIDTYQTFLNSRPDSWEVSAIEMIIRRLEAQAEDDTVTTPTRAHIVHLSSSLALPLIKSARARGLPLTSETCFHYLFLSSDHVPDTEIAATEYKCCPPIRTESNRDALWDALEAGLIDYVVSDHSPCLPEMKKGGYLDAWGGVSGLGLGLSLLWTEITRRNAKKRAGEMEGELIGLDKVAQWCCAKTAEQVGLGHRKGAIQEGADADFVVFDPEQSWEVKREGLKFRNKVSPYIGRTLQGCVQQTYLRGKLVFDRAGAPTSTDRLGELL